MLTARITLLISLCSIGCAVAQLLPLEQRIVGTWQFSSIDATGRMIFRADHTYSTMFPFSGLHDWKVVTRGTWRIEGHYLVVAEKDVFRPIWADGPARPIRRARVPIRLISNDKFDLDRVIMKRVQ